MNTYLIIFCFALTGIVFIASCNETPPTVPPQPTDKPEVKIIQPENNAQIKNSGLIKAEASDDKGIFKLEIYIDNQTDSNRTFIFEPYEYLWTLEKEPDSTQHKIYAKAYDGDDNVTSSSVITIYHVAIEAPSDFDFKSLSDKSIELSWTDNSNDETGFLIERKEDPGAYKTIKTTSENVTTFIDTPLYAYKTYHYRIRSFSNKDTSDYSPELSIEYKKKFFLTENINGNPTHDDKLTPIAIIPGTDIFFYAFKENYAVYYKSLSKINFNEFNLNYNNGKITSIAVDPSGKVLIGTAKGKIFLYQYPDFSNGTLFQQNAEPVTDLLFLENHTLFAAASESGIITLFDYNGIATLYSYQNMENQGRIMLEYNTDKQFLVNGSLSGYLMEWNIRENRLERKTAFENSIVSLELNPISHLLYAGFSNGKVTIMDALTLSVTSDFRAHYYPITGIKVDKQTGKYITASEDGSLKIWTSAGEKYFTLDSNMRRAVSVEATDNFKFIVAGSDNKIYIWQNLTGWHRQ